MKKLTPYAVAAFALLTALPAMAADDIEYPAPTPYPFQRSFRTCETVGIPPYRHPFAVRVYTTPAQQPYYNVPPYSVIAPY